MSNGAEIKWPENVEGPYPNATTPSNPEYEVVIPGLEDIVHIPLWNKMTDEERRARARTYYYNIKKSPTPKWVQKMSRIGTEIDNIEDAFTTAMVAVRLFGKHIAPKIGARLLPYVGEALIAKDVMDIGSAICYTASGPHAAKRLFETVKQRGARMRKWNANMRDAGKWIPHKQYVHLRNLYNKAGQDIGKTDNKYKKKFLEARQKNMRKALRGLPGFGETLEILQTADWITGYGISLGAIFGPISDAFWGTLRSLTGDKVNLKLSPALQKEVRAYLGNQALLTVPPLMIVACYEEIAKELFAHGEMMYTDRKTIEHVFQPGEMTVKHHSDIDIEWDDLNVDTSMFLCSCIPEPKTPTHETTKEVLHEMGINPDIPVPALIPENIEKEMFEYDPYWVEKSHYTEDPDMHFTAMESMIECQKNYHVLDEALLKLHKTPLAYVAGTSMYEAAQETMWAMNYGKDPEIRCVDDTVLQFIPYLGMCEITFPFPTPTRLERLYHLYNEFYWQSMRPPGCTELKQLVSMV